MDRKFVVLMRRASESRCILAKKLLDCFGHDSVRITLGTFPDTIPSEWKQLVGQYNYPMVVDSCVVDKQQHNPGHKLFYTTPVQLVVETSHETDRDSWRNIFLTEKSYKPFAWHQFPIWYAVPGTVDKLRIAGFDLFDDLIDHSYDYEQDPFLRMDKVVTELQKFCKNDTAQFLRFYHWDRLEYNAQLVEKIIKTAYIIHKQKAQELQDELLQFCQ